MDYSSYLSQNAYDSCLGGMEGSSLGIPTSYGEFSSAVGSHQPSQPGYPYSGLRSSMGYGSSPSGMASACNLASMMDHQQVPQCSPYSSGEYLSVNISNIRYKVLNRFILFTTCIGIYLT